MDLDKLQPQSEPKAGEAEGLPYRLRSKGHSIRSALFGMAAIPLIALMAFMAYDSYYEFTANTAEAYRTASVIRALSAEQTEQFLERTRSILMELSRRPLVQTLDAGNCDPLLAEVKKLEPGYANLITLDTKGRIVCSAAGMAPGQPPGPDPKYYFDEVVRRRQFTVGKPAMGVITGRQVSTLAYPIENAAGQLLGVVGASVDLVNYKPLVSREEMPPLAVVGIINGQGNVIARSDGSAQRVGTVFDAEAARTMLRERQGTMRSRDDKGVEQFYSFAPIANSDWIAWVSLDHATTLAPVIDRAFERLALFIALVLAVVAITTLLARRIAKPIEALFNTMTRVGTGAVNERATPVGPTELRRIASELNTMLDLRLQAEADLRRSEERYRTVVQSASDAIVTSDSAGNIVGWNRSAELAFGYSEAEMVGSPLSLLIPERYRERHFAGINRALTGKMPRLSGKFVELTGVRKDGSEFPIELSLARWESGESYFFTGTLRDITKRKSDEEQLRKLAQAVEQSSESIVITNLDAEIEYVNEAFVQNSGYSRDDVIGQNPRLLNSGQNPPEIYVGLWGELTQGRPWQGELQNRRKDGSIYIESIRISPIRQIDGRITHYLAIKKDITEHERKERERESLEKQLHQAQKMELIGHLTGGVAHDFNNILASMFGYAELMEMSPEIESNPQLNAYLQGLLEAGIRARELVAQLLTFSHRRESAAESIAVTPIVNEVVKLLRATLPTSISIRTSIASGLPEVLISPIQLHQIVMNLGINARDAIGGAGTIEITVGQAVVENETACHACHLNFSGRYLMLSVRDTGAGIPAENLLKIFDPFFTTKGVRQGSGLGLSVVHGIVHSANGHIQVETTPGEGTELRVYLPAQLSKVTGLARRVRPAGDEVRVGGHVLVVDDDEIIVCVVTTMLESLGCKVTGLSSSTEALRLFRSNPHGVDMVVTDQTMPELTGAELARAMLELRPEMPIVLSTGFSDSIDENAALQMGIRHFLAKPVSARSWAAVVAECLAVRTAGD